MSSCGTAGCERPGRAAVPVGSTTLTLCARCTVSALMPWLPLLELPLNNVPVTTMLLVRHLDPRGDMSVSVASSGQTSATELLGMTVWAQHLTIVGARQV
jgi:hypothetical protein